MEATEVIIVGAGPSGMALGLSLARFNVKSVILEQELCITDDPRGVYLTHDAIRILWDLGIGDSFDRIGHEEALEKNINGSPFCELRRGCIVIGRDELNNRDSIVFYNDSSKGSQRAIRGSWLVGADGKRSIVRKYFLEPTAGVRQVNSTYRYDGTWVAANLKLTLPTPQTHPEFPLWKLGYTPEMVYELFWPQGWHFCSPPGTAVASGRFGPHEHSFWRHEFAQPHRDDENMDAESLLWKHIMPMITHSADSNTGVSFPHEVTFPRDCIQVRRCRPYHFTHRVVNKWFHHRTVLIGDAAHVFPPLGGQGIASGLRDAHQLAWPFFFMGRLRRLLDGGENYHLCDAVLESWARKRRYGMREAAWLTNMNGTLCNHGDSFGFWLYRTLSKGVVPYIPFLHPETRTRILDPQKYFEIRAYQPVTQGCLLPKFCGGRRLAQIHVQSNQQGSSILFDELLRHGTCQTAMTLLVMVTGDGHRHLLDEAKAAIRAVDIDDAILSEK